MGATGKLVCPNRCLLYLQRQSVISFCQTGGMITTFLVNGNTKRADRCSRGKSLLFFLGSWHLGSGGELLDGTVVVLGGQSLQGAPAVCMQLDDLHKERAGELRFGRTKHLVPDSC